MKERERIFDLLNSLSEMDEVPKVRINGWTTGATLYEGNIYGVPFSLCSDYVLRHETFGDVVVITSTYAP